MSASAWLGQLPWCRKAHRRPRPCAPFPYLSTLLSGEARERKTEKLSREGSSVLCPHTNLSSSRSRPTAMPPKPTTTLAHEKLLKEGNAEHRSYSPCGHAVQEGRGTVNPPPSWAASLLAPGSSLHTAPGRGGVHLLPGTDGAPLLAGHRSRMARESLRYPDSDVGAAHVFPKAWSSGLSPGTWKAQLRAGFQGLNGPRQGPLLQPEFRLTEG